ncbi:MAG: ferrochelatase [Chlorobaculum sp.]|nr:ferrochelatase [Chlorobaculum sp.]
MMGAKRMVVVLVAHGEAETAGFLDNYRVSLHTLQRASEVIPVPLPLRHFISLSSSVRKKIGKKTSGSPQNPLTRQQARALQAHLDGMNAGVTFEVIASFSASEPSVEAVLEKRHGFDGVIVVPMAPVDNAMSCGLLCAHLSKSCSPDELARTRVVGRLWEDETLHRVYLDYLFGSGRALPSGPRERNALMLLFHGTLVEDRNGAPPAFHTGHAETVEFARRLAVLIESDPRTPWGTVMTAFLNHDVGGKWSNPSFEEAVRMLGGKGFQHVSLFAAGYFSDGNETIHREPALSAIEPGVVVESIPCLNDSPHLIACLAQRIVTASRQILAFSGDFERMIV